LTKYTENIVHQVGLIYESTSRNTRKVDQFKDKMAQG